MKTTALILFLFISATSLRAQKLSQQDVVNMINSKQITFQPQSIVTGGGKSKQLTPDFSLKISGDSLISNLPYFGQAYNAPINSSDAGLNFTSSNFTYTSATGKKGKTIISIHTNDKVYNTDFILTVYTNGTAYLQANNTDKQPVSYNGYLIR